MHDNSRGVIVQRFSRSAKSSCLPDRTISALGSKFSKFSLNLVIGPARAPACAGLPAQFASAASLSLKFEFG